jgi:hypothetical protein
LRTGLSLLNGMSERLSMVESKIIDLNAYRATQALDTDVIVDRQSLKYRREARTQVGEEQFPSHSTRETSLDDLYSSEASAGALIMRVRELLSEMAERAKIAHESLASDDLMGADQEVNLIQADLPELFCCRDISEGLAAFTVALHYALLNRKDSTLNLAQIYVLKSCIDQLCESPIIGFEAGLDLIDRLANEGFITDPPEAKALSDIFVSEESSN